MKISALLKVLIAIILLLMIPISCEKENHTVVKKIDNTAEIKRLTTIADKDFDQNNYLKAYKNYLIIVQLCDPEKNRIDYVDALISIALIQQIEGNYLESEITATKVLPHLKYLKKPRFAWETYKVFADNYLATNDYENALLYTKKAYNLNTTSRRKANALANIALVYMYQENYKKAIKIYNQLTTSGYYADKKKNNTLEGFELMDYAVIISNIGISYGNLHDTTALGYYKEALKLRLQSNDRQNISDSYSNLSEYYLEINPSLAKKYAETAYRRSLAVNTYKQKKYALECLTRASTGNDLKKYANLYINFNDSVTSARLKQKNQFALLKYNSTKDKEENLELKTQKAEDELDLERQKNRSYISYILIFLSVFILLFIVFHVTSKSKREISHAVFKSEMRISQKLHKELSSDVFKLFTNIQNTDLGEPENKEEVINRLDFIYAKTRKISKENSAIITDEHYVVGLKEMISEYSNSNLNILINGLNSFSWTKMDRNKKITVYRILQELLENINKNNTSLISITFKKNEKDIEIIYVDNNTEINRNEINLKKILQNVENRIKTIRGTSNFESNLENGFKISFTLPI